MSNIKRKVATLGVATATMAGGIGLVSVPPASAATMRCSLTLNNMAEDSRFERYSWSCVNRPVQDQLQYADFRGSDPWYDEEDDLYRVYGGPADFRVGTIEDQLLNEDGNGNGDEIYIKLRLRRPNGTEYSVSSNKLNRNYDT